MKNPILLLVLAISLTGCSSLEGESGLTSNDAQSQHLQQQPIPLESVLLTIPKDVNIPAKALVKTHRLATSSPYANGNFGIIDFTIHSAKPRFHVFSKFEGYQFSVHVSHGIRSGRAYANKFSNQDGSNMSPTGFILGAESYVGKNGYSLRVDSMESVNSNVRQRNIRLHPSDYATQEHISVNKMLGRSDGCFAVPPTYSDAIINLLKGGGIIYIHHDGKVR